MTPTLSSPSRTSWDGERGEQHSENLLGHEQAALVEPLADTIGPPEYDDVEGEYHREDGNHHRDYADRVRLGESVTIELAGVAGFEAAAREVVETTLDCAVASRAGVSRPAATGP